MVIILLGLSYLFIDKMPYGKPVQTRMSLNYFPLTIGEWKGQDVLQEQKELPSNTDEYLYRKYINANGESLFLYVGYWGKYRHGADVYSGRHLVPEYKWNTVSGKIIFLDINGERIPVKRTVYAKGNNKISLVYFYVTDQRVSTKRYTERFRSGINAMFNRKTSVALIKISSEPYHSDESEELINDQREFAEKVFRHLSTEFLPFREAES